MFKRHPEMAKAWVEKYGMPKNLPEKIGKKGKKYYSKGAIKKARNKA